MLIIKTRLSYVVYEVTRGYLFKLFYRPRVDWLMWLMKFI